MPNHCENRVYIEGPEAVLEKVADLLNTKETMFDLNAIVPMPEALNITSGSGAKALFDDDEARLMLRYSWVKDEGVTTIEQLRRFLCERYKPRTETDLPTLQDFADRIRDNLARYGSEDWYDWRIRNWGTKWNTYDASLSESPGQLVYTFLTAWSPPDAALEALADRFPGIYILNQWHEEGGCHGSDDYHTPLVA